ncbi:MAG: DUF1360 domain-containing protein [Acidobacteria bacterium]|nr:DUF1360 domain-containing protein [Acidobacteriota bacterium]
MFEKEAAFKFVLAVLATWRFTHLLSKEDGPGDVVFRLRVRLGEGFWGKLMDCFKCLSLWVAAPMAFYIARQPMEVILVWLAISGAACLLERIGQESVMVQPFSHHSEEVQYGLLRSETTNTPEYGSANDDDG